MWGCTAVMGGLMTRTVVSAQLSNPLMPLRLRANFGHKFEEGEVATSNLLGLWPYSLANVTTCASWAKSACIHVCQPYLGLTLMLQDQCMHMLAGPHGI